MSMSGDGPRSVYQLASSEGYDGMWVASSSETGLPILPAQIPAIGNVLFADPSGKTLTLDTTIDSVLSLASLNDRNWMAWADMNRPMIYLVIWLLITVFSIYSVGRAHKRRLETREQAEAVAREKDGLE